jgi:hypothetical protein
MAASLVRSRSCGPLAVVPEGLRSSITRVAVAQELEGGHLRAKRLLGTLQPSRSRAVSRAIWPSLAS